MNTFSKFGTLIALSATAALLGTGCAAEFDEQDVAELASVEENADSALETLAVTDESADVADDEGTTAEDGSALSTNWGYGYGYRRGYGRRYFERDGLCGNNFRYYGGRRYFGGDCYRRYFDGDCGGRFRDWDGGRFFDEGCFDGIGRHGRYYGW